MDSELLRSLGTEKINRIRAEVDIEFPFQVALINLDNKKDPSAILLKSESSITILSDRHSYSKPDRIFPVNQDENTVFAQEVFQDSLKNKYHRTIDICTGSGVIAMALAKAGAGEVLATDINPRAREFVEKNNKLNNLSVKFIESDLFTSIQGKFDKITINPPFMPAPEGTFPLHAQGGSFGIENVVKPFFENCWGYVNKGGCIQGIFHSFANDNSDTVLDLLNKNLPDEWSYEIQHVFPVKNIPIELYTTAFTEHVNYKEWLNQINHQNFKYMRFFILTIRNEGKKGLIKE